jgi:hypothetical protein
MGSASHLVTRFFGSLRSGPPNAADLRWARSRLSDGEWLLFERMSNPDQRHSVEVARAVVGALPDAEPEVIAAAFLHDVGKVESGFGTPARVLATVFWAIVPDRLADSWLRAPLPLRKLAQYRRHPEIGEQLLLDAGAHPVTASWAADHHRSMEKWRVDVRIGRVLKSCDGD